MRNTFKAVMFVFVMSGVFGADEGKSASVSVMEGDSVTLNLNLTRIQGFNKIEWKFANTTLARAKIANVLPYPDQTVISKDRLHLNKTGSLTIRNMRTNFSGQYEAVVFHNSGTNKTQIVVTVYGSPLVINAHKAETKSLSVTEGNPVTLHTDFTELHGDELIVWRFGDEGKLLAKEDKETKSSPYYDTDERFRDRLKLHDQTGSLTINNMKDTDAGLYTLKINCNNDTLYKKFTVTVSGSGVSSAAVAGIIIVLLLLFAVVAGLGFLYHRRKISKQHVEKPYHTAEGENVTLKTKINLLKGDEIQWWFRNENSPIAEIIEGIGETYGGPDEIFRDRLELDETGSLTIKKVRHEHTGEYRSKIINCSGETINWRFSVHIKEEEKMLVSPGESVTLKADAEIQREDEVQWLFKVQNDLIAKMTGNTREIIYPDERFRDTLKMDKKTGFLTINNIEPEHTGLYKLKINSRGEATYKTFSVYINALTNEKLIFEGRIGESVTLKPDIKIQRNNEIQWMIADQDRLIAKMTRGARKITYHDERFRDRLELNKKTGSLTINNITIKDIREYKMKIISSSGTTEKKFRVLIKGDPVFFNEGDRAVLQCAADIQTDKIEWRFKSEESPIAEVEGGQIFLYNGSDMRFRDGLEVDERTGSLIIKNFRHEHVGLYQLMKKSSSTGDSVKAFNLFVREKKINTAERENVTLKTETKLLEGDEIQWWFSNENFLIAEIIEGIGETYSGPKKRFSDCLELDKETGSLTIKNIRRKHTGDYRLKIIKRSGETSNCNFSVHIKEEKMIVIRGESVTLKADAEIQREDEVQWMFKVQNDLIAKMTGNTRKIIYPDERFSDTLKMDEKTGSLTINNIEPEHTGLYKLKIISRGEATYKTFTVYFHEIIPKKYIIDGRIDESVTLNPDIEIQRNNEIQWMIGDQDCLIAKMTRGARKITYHDERFRDRLVLNEKTGSLTINNITIEDNRDYKLRIISSSGTTENKFSVLIKGKPSFFCEGDRAVLQCAAEIQTDEIEWRFEGEESPIAEVEGGQIVPYNGPNWRFRDRLEVDKSNGSLTIKNIRREHEGLYQLKRKSSGTADSFYAFTVTVYDSIIVGWVGKSVTLKSDTEIQRNYEILWLIEDRLIAKLTREAREITYLDERFRDRLVLDEETGSLTINNITVEDNRAYKMRIISSSGTTEKKFGVLIKGVPMSFNEGDRAVLQCAADIQTDEIEWRFKSVESPIAEVKGGQIIPYNGPDRRFKDGLKIDEKTGSLIISNIRREHEGLYQLMKKSSSTGHNISAFDVMVYGSTGNQVNDSVTEESPLLYEDDQNVVYENERMSSL
nr:uncharacterized protein LOC100536726 [Danio rerio]|eukprot:XP_021325232.1 uncharacterized protein LOC100536726 [Danio rerio]